MKQQHGSRNDLKMKRALAGLIRPHLKGYLVAAYAKAPRQVEELHELLTRYNVDERLKTEIVKELDESP
jgi:hypothetical protein